MPDTKSDITSVLENTYARSLLEMVDEQLSGAVDEIAAELQQLLDLTQSKPELMQLISTRTMSASDRAGVITRVFKGRITDLVYHFLLTVNEKNRHAQLHQSMADVVLSAMEGTSSSGQTGHSHARGIENCT